MSLLSEFPALRTSQAFRITSPPARDYNCIAWAAQAGNAWWWPDPMLTAYWPPEIPREETLTAFSSAFRTLGYEECDSADLEEGIQKIALFARGGTPTHAARQLANGRWTSKLGNGEDIQHELRDVEGPLYGRVVKLFHRPRRP
jgi:hypothetical protein